MKSAVVERVKETWDTTRRRVGHRVGELESRAKRSFVDLERKAKGSIDEVPEQLRGAWDRVLQRLLTGLEVATREDLHALARQVENLSRRLDGLAQQRVRRGAGTTKR